MDRIIINLPFDEKQHPINITQGNNGPFSHRPKLNIDLSFAVDFGLPIGAEVIAARAGRVSFVLHNSNIWYGGIMQSVGDNLGLFATNKILVAAADGGTDCYSHLEKGSAFVRAGDQVHTGQVIARIGYSGWVLEDCPHLHFHIQEDRRGRLVTIPFKIEGHFGSLDDRDIRK